VTSRLLNVETTVATLDDAQQLARALVEQRLAACAEVSAIESVYRWKGAVHNEPEYRVVFKTIEARYDEVEAAIRVLHRYELPAIHATSAGRVFAPYEAWVAEMSQPEAQAGEPTR